MNLLKRIFGKKNVLINRFDRRHSYSGNYEHRTLDVLKSISKKMFQSDLVKHEKTTWETYYKPLKYYFYEQTKKHNSVQKGAKKTFTKANRQYREILVKYVQGGWIKRFAFRVCYWWETEVTKSQKSNKKIQP